MPTWRWTFYDPIDDVTVELPLNPSEGGTPGHKKRLTRIGTTAPNTEGRTVIFEGTDEAGTFKVSGTILTQAHLELFQEWCDKRHQIRVDDDLGRSYWIYIEEFTPQRIRRASHPWAHSFDLTAVVLDVP